MNKLISILMPVKNAEPHLKACLDSIQKQSYSNWELMAVDDHSNDGSHEILKSYAFNDTRIKIFKSEFHGIIPALKLAFKESKANLITRMDADDIMFEDKIECLALPLLTASGQILSVAKVKYFSDEGIKQGYLKYEQWLNGLVDSQTHYSEIYKECTIPSICWMTQRATLEKIGIFDSELYPEDYDMCFRLYANKIPIVSIDKPLHYWRDHSQRTSRNDPTYLDNRFLDLKLHYFKTLEIIANTKVVLWGAGAKGKFIAKYFIDQELNFSWCTNNPKKINTKIYDKLIIDQNDIAFDKSMKHIIAIANPDEQEKLLSTMKSQKLALGKDFFFFC